MHRKVFHQHHQDGKEHKIKRVEDITCIEDQRRHGRQIGMVGGTRSNFKN